MYLLCICVCLSVSLPLCVCAHIHMNAFVHTCMHHGMCMWVKGQLVGVYYGSLLPLCGA